MQNKILNGLVIITYSLPIMAPYEYLLTNLLTFSAFDPFISYLIVSRKHGGNIMHYLRYRPKHKNVINK